MTKEDLDLIVDWFAHIEQIATDRKTKNGAVMEDWAALDEIKCKAKNCQEYIKAYCYEPSLPSSKRIPKIMDYPFDVPDNDGCLVFTPMRNETIRKKFNLKKGERVIISIRKEK